MIEYCQTMADIRKWLFTYREQPIGFITDHMNDDEFESHSSLTNSDCYNQLRCRNINIIASTPTTDDEGYRTRLPTTASAESTYTHIIGSPVLYQTNYDCNSQYDDECF